MTQKPTLLEFAAKLDTLELAPNEKFDMRWWNSQEALDCGTAACAVGWGILKGWLPGMHFARNGEPVYVDTEDPLQDGMDAVQEYFKLPTFTATLYLFGGHNREKDTPQIVADRIRQWVAETNHAH